MPTVATSISTWWGPGSGTKAGWTATSPARIRNDWVCSLGSERVDMNARLARRPVGLPGTERRSLPIGQRGLPDHDRPGGGLGASGLPITDPRRPGERPGAGLRDQRRHLVPAEPEVHRLPILQVLADDHPDVLGLPAQRTR